MKTTLITLCALILSLLCGCGEVTRGVGGTETGTTDPSLIGERVETAASALVPNISESDMSGLAASAALTFAESGQWDTYTSEENIVYLSDIFGDTENGPVTQIRVLLDQFKNDLDSLFGADPEIACAGASLFSGADTVEIAFYDPIPNGSADDRFYDCISQESGDGGGQATLYGQDGAGVVRIIKMQDDTSTNTEQVETRGNQVRIQSVVRTSYAEATEDGQGVVYLDLQYAQASVYNGPDGDFSTIDGGNVIFKSRSRITGRVVLDESGVSDGGFGDFQVTKYDAGGPAEGQSDPNTTVTQTIGRGSFGENDFAIFNIDSNAGSLEGDAGVFCLQFPETEGGSPAAADEANCAGLEEGYAWGSVTFPFALEPSVNQSFEDKAAFGETDLIANDGSDFMIPDYK